MARNVAAALLGKVKEFNVLIWYLLSCEVCHSIVFSWDIVVRTVKHTVE